MGGFIGELLQLHRVDALADLVFGERLEVGRQAEQRGCLNEPFRRIVSELPVRVSIVHRELVVEIVVALADRHERRNDMVSRRMFVIERRLTEPVRERVDAERRVMDKQQASGTGKEESAAPVAPSETGDSRGEDEAHKDEQREVVLVLPSNNLVARQVGHVGDANLGPRLDEHPSDVGPPEAVVCAVRVQVGVGVSVVGSVTAGPPFDGALDSTGAGACEDVLKERGSVVRSVGPETMVARGDTETGDVVVDDSARAKASGSAVTWERHGKDTHDHQNVLVFQLVVQIP